MYLASFTNRLSSVVDGFPFPAVRKRCPGFPRMPSAEGATMTIRGDINNQATTDSVNAESSAAREPEELEDDDPPEEESPNSVATSTLSIEESEWNDWEEEICFSEWQSRG